MLAKIGTPNQMLLAQNQVLFLSVFDVQRPFRAKGLRWTK